MEDLRKKIVLDLCVTPGTIIPTAIGVSALLLSVVFGSTLAFVGFVGCLIGAGALVTNVIFRLGTVSQNAAKSWQRQQQKKKEMELDHLDKQLMRTRETKDEIALRNLRALYNNFCKDYEEGKITRNVSANMLQQIDEMFESCIHQLDRSVELWEQAREVQGDLKKGLKSQRREVLHEVESSVELLAHAMNEVRSLKLKAKSGELKRLQDKLSSQLEVAKATEERVLELDMIGQDDSEKYSEYIN